MNSGEGEEEEREQCSPVSVLDLPFEDGHDPEGEGDGGFDYECSLANVQSMYQQLIRQNIMSIERTSVRFFFFAEILFNIHVLLGLMVSMWSFSNNLLEYIQHKTHRKAWLQDAGPLAILTIYT